MITTSVPSLPETASLVRSTDNAESFPLLGRVSERFGRGVREVLVALGRADVRVTAQSTTVSKFSDLRTLVVNDHAICLFRLMPTRSAALLILPGPFLGQIVDSYYGGSGDTLRGRQGLSKGERQVLSRFGQRCGDALAVAWSEFVAVAPELAIASDDWSGIEFVREADPVVAQRFRIGGDGLRECDVILVFPADALHTLCRRSNVDAAVTADAGDAEWRDRLATAVLQTRLHLGTVFARPVMPLSKLLTLAPGDIMPITLPTHIPVTVGGRLFAEASVGEANGRAAIKIEALAGTHNE